MIPKINKIKKNNKILIKIKKDKKKIINTPLF
jgi:hypothetical protein